MSSLFLSEQNQNSGRFVFLADEGTAVWMYLTAPNEQTIVADCWVHNLVPAPEDLTEYRGKDSPPPATKEFAKPGSFQPLPDPSSVQFVWAPDGESVSLFIGNVLYGFIAAGVKNGFSRFLIKSGPFGAPIDDLIYKALFPRPSFDA